MRDVEERNCEDESDKEDGDDGQGPGAGGLFGVGETVSGVAAEGGDVGVLIERLCDGVEHETRNFLQWTKDAGNNWMLVIWDLMMNNFSFFIQKSYYV